MNLILKWTENVGCKQKMRRENKLHTFRIPLGSLHITDKMNINLHGARNDRNVCVKRNKKYSIPRNFTAGMKIGDAYALNMQIRGDIFMAFVCMLCFT